MSSHRITSRTRARKRAIDTLFEADQRGFQDSDGILDVLDARREITAAQTPLPQYAIEAVQGVADHIYQIDDLLNVHTTTRSFDRLPATDRAILRLATWEIVWNDDVPSVTAIDEAVTIAKEISTDESPSIVNAVLDAIRKEASTVQETDEAFEAALAPRDEEDVEDVDHAEPEEAEGEKDSEDHHVEADAESAESSTTQLNNS